MALAEAILVCLTDRPMTGYELAKAFDTSIGFFWRASHQQIYRELQSLRADGLADAEEVVQTGRPNKTVYTITQTGLARLREWSRVPTDRPPPRDNMLVKLYALDSVDLDALGSEIAARLAKHRERQELYERILKNRFLGKRQGRRDTGLLLGLKFGLMIERGHISWCADALSTIEQLRQANAKASARPPRRSPKVRRSAAL